MKWRSDAVTKSGWTSEADFPAKPFPAFLELKAGSAAVDQGQVLPNVNDGFAGAAPDLGAHELGLPLPHYGPRPAERRRGAQSRE